MARRKKKKNSYQSIINLIILIILLSIIFFLIQRFLIPFFQEIKEPKIIEKKEEVKVEEQTVDLEEEQIVLFFADDNAQYLIPEYRKVKKVKEIQKQAVIELIKGPTNNNLYPTIPPTTKVNNVYISDGIAYVDFSSELINNHSGGSTGELLTVYSIVFTLSAFPDINKVQILVDGNSRETLVGHVDISAPLERDDSWLKK